MYKVIGGVAIIASFFIMGVKKSIELKRRCQSLEKMILCVKYIASRVSYGKDRVEKLFCDTAREFSMPIFYDTALKIKACGVKQAWQTSLKQYKKEFNFTDQDISACKMLENLGEFSGREQESNIKTTQKLLELSLGEAKESCIKNAKLYSSGGALCGILAVILLL